jgi:hypothetical protein
MKFDRDKLKQEWPFLSDEQIEQYNRENPVRFYASHKKKIRIKAGPKITPVLFS